MAEMPTQIPEDEFSKSTVAALSTSAFIPNPIWSTVTAMDKFKAPMEFTLPYSSFFESTKSWSAVSEKLSFPVEVNWRSSFDEILSVLTSPPWLRSSINTAAIAFDLTASPSLAAVNHLGSKQNDLDKSFSIASTLSLLNNVAGSITFGMAVDALSQPKPEFAFLNKDHLAVNILTGSSMTGLFPSTLAATNSLIDPTISGSVSAYYPYTFGKSVAIHENEKIWMTKGALVDSINGLSYLNRSGGVIDSFVKGSAFVQSSGLFETTRLPSILSSHFDQMEAISDKISVIGTQSRLFDFSSYIPDYLKSGVRGIDFTQHAIIPSTRIEGIGGTLYPYSVHAETKDSSKPGKDAIIALMKRKGFSKDVIEKVGDSEYEAVQLDGKNYFVHVTIVMGDFNIIGNSNTQTIYL